MKNIYGTACNRSRANCTGLSVDHGKKYIDYPVLLAVIQRASTQVHGIVQEKTSCHLMTIYIVNATHAMIRSINNYN